MEPPNLETMATARALIGALIFIASTFRPDIAHAVYRVATRMGKPTAKTVVASRRILAYLCKTSTLGLRYGGSGPANITLQAIRKPFDEGHDRSCERLHAVTLVFVPFPCVCHGPGVSPGRMPASAWCLLPRHRLLRPCRDKRHVNPHATRSGCEPTLGVVPAH